MMLVNELNALKEESARFSNHEEDSQYKKASNEAVGRKHSINVSSMNNENNNNIMHINQEIYHRTGGSSNSLNNLMTHQ